MSPSKPKKNRSMIWNYFSKTDSPFKAMCKQCHKLFSYSGGSLNNLLRHIQRKHFETVKNMQGIKSISRNISRNDCEPIQTVLEFEHENVSGTRVELATVDDGTELVQQPTYYFMEQVDVHKVKEMDRQVLRIIVKELHPFSIIENPEFIKFVSMLNPTYTLPSRTSLSNELLQMYKSVVTEVKSALKDAASVALTTDRWTSINNEDFIAVTAYFLDESLELQAKLLDCASFQKISLTNIVVFLQELAAFWGLSKKVVAVVTEDVPLLTEAVKECQWQHIPCFAHVLNRIAKRGLEDIDFIIKRVRDIVFYFKKSELVLTNFSTLQSEMGLADIKLKKDSSVYWNSTFEMMTAFLKNKDSLTATADLLGVDLMKLSQSEWSILENAVKLLIPFNSITTEICSDKVVPLSKIPHMVRFMIKHVTNAIEQENSLLEVNKMACTLKQELTEQFKNFESHDVVCQSVLLDPRMKKRGFQESSSEEAYSSLLKEVVSLKNEKVRERNKENGGPECESDSQNNKQLEYFIDMWSEFRENDTAYEVDVTPAATAEVDAFLTQPYMSMKEDPITYWANEMNQNKFPTLFEVAKNRLCVPATSVPSRNIFSKSGSALSRKRTLLTSGKLKEILFLHENLS